MMTSPDKIPRIPKYVTLAELLRIKIQTGKLKPGEQLPTVGELRTEYNVSCSTIEKVHSLLEKEGLIIREQGRGVFVSRSQENRRPPTGVIGFIGYGFISEVRNSLFWARLLRGIQEGAIREKTQLMLLNEGMDSSVWEKVDGVLLSEGDFEVNQDLDRLPLGMPCISMITPARQISSIVFDDYQGAKDSTKHLISLGHERIYYMIDLESNNEVLNRRLAGYQDAIVEAGIKLQDSWVRPLPKDYWYFDKVQIDYQQGARKSFEDWLATTWKEDNCTAILMQNDQAAMGAIKALQAAGIRVPQDVSVIGFDGIDLQESGLPELTTVELPIEKVGAAAVQLLRKLIEARQNGYTPWVETITLPTRFCEGATTERLMPKF
jgi:GntR family transcriptional regulator of arabinose operon